MNIDLPALYEKQAELILSPTRYVCIEGSTKSGKTVGCIIWQAREVLTSPRDTIHWWVAPTYQQARIAHKRVVRDFGDLVQRAVESPDLEIQFVQGGRWVFRSGENPDNLYGEEVTTAVLDEASRMREGSWHAVRSTLSTTQGHAIMIGNVRGRANWFYKLCRRAQSGLDGYLYGMLTAQDAIDGGVFPPSELNEARRDLPEAVFRELYFCEPADDQNNPFGYDALSDAFTPVSGEPVVFGLDVARKHDHTVLCGLSVAGDVVAFDRFQLPWGEAYDRIADQVKNTPVLMDATGIGDPIIDALRERRLNVEGFVWTARSKQDLMVALRIAFSERRVRHHNDTLRIELESYEYNYTRTSGVRYSAPEGMHDDCVDALALAWYHGQQLGVVGSRVRDMRVMPIGVKTRVSYR